MPQLKVTVKVNWNAGIPLIWIQLKLIEAGGIREAIRIYIDPDPHSSHGNEWRYAIVDRFPRSWTAPGI